MVKLKPTPGQPGFPVDYQQAVQIIGLARERGKIFHAEFMARQLGREFPDDVDAQLLLLACHTDVNRGEDAPDLARDLVARYPDDVRVLTTVAKYHINRNEKDFAIDLLERSLNIGAGYFDTYFALGNIYRDTGRKSEAVAAYTRALELKPDVGAVHFALARLSGNGESAGSLDKMTSLLASDSLHPVDRSQLHKAVAWHCRDKHIDRQFRHLDAASEILSEYYPWDPASSEARMKAITGFFRNDDVASLRGESDLEFSPIYIAAAPRSGTTLIEQILGAHSHTEALGEARVLSLAISEAYFSLDWGSDYTAVEDVNELRKFLALVDKSIQEQVRGFGAGGKRIVEKSLDNYMCGGLILLTHPDAKIIHMRRHPLDTLLSLYEQYIEVGESIPFRLADLAIHYQHTTAYMEHWQRLFPENVLTVDYEKLVTEPESSIMAILDFCGLPWEQACLEFHKQRSLVSTPSTDAVRTPMYTESIGRWRPYARFLKPAAERLGIEID